MSSTTVYDPSFGAVTISAPRRLGSALAAPRDAYLVYMPLFLVAMALVCWVAPTDLMLMAGSVALAGISAYLMYGLAVQQAPLRISTLLVATLGLGYGLGTANTWFTLPRSGVDLGAFLHRDPPGLTHTMGSVLFSLALTLAIGEYAEQPIFGEDFVLEFRSQEVLFLNVGLGLLLVAFATGKLSFMGATIGEEGQLGVFASFAAWLASALLGITLVAGLNSRGRFLRWYLMALAAIEFLLTIPLGRRTLIYTLVLAAISFRLGRFRFRWSWPKRLVIAGIMGAVLYAATIGFYYMRLAGFASGKTHLGLGERISLAIGYFHSTSFDQVQQAFSENVQGRTFILGFLSQLEDYSAHFDAGRGRDLGGQVLEAVPSVLYPSKDRHFEEEGLANELFGTAYIDEANSILTCGAVDFGLLGMVLYPLLISFVLRAFVEFTGEHLPTFVAVFIIFSGLGDLLQPETTITGYVVFMRNGLLFGCVVWFFVALPAFRLRTAVR